jgi:hypothetical protein
MTSLSPKMERVRDHIAWCLDRVKEAFKPGVKITILVRTPGLPDRDFAMTDDTWEEAIGMLQRRSEAQDTITVPPDGRESSI